MAKKKYVRDYEISDTIDEKGRVRSVPVYVGSYFCFCDAAAAKKSGRLLAPAAALGWLAYIMALWLPSGAGKLMYVILPFVFAAVPLWYVSSAVVALLRAGDKLKSSEAETVAGDLPLDIRHHPHGGRPDRRRRHRDSRAGKAQCGGHRLCRRSRDTLRGVRALVLPPSGGSDEAYLIQLLTAGLN